MSENKMKPTEASVRSFLEGVSDKRRDESNTLIAMMQEISGEQPVMWGPSIIGFGSIHYKYDSGREGDVPKLAFSPRKANLTIYFEGFDDYGHELAKLGKYKTSVACLYINKLEDVDQSVLRSMLERSFARTMTAPEKAVTVGDYIAAIPAATRPLFDELRQMVRQTLPQAEEAISYGIVGYKIDDKRARVYISGWKDHVALYPVPNDNSLQKELHPYIKGKGTLWFKPNDPLPKQLIERTVRALAS